MPPTRFPSWWAATKSRSDLPAKLAESLGYFKDEGLEVELLNESAGVDAENQLLAGAVQGVVGFYDHCVDLQAKGKFIKSIVQFSQAPGEVELVSTKHPELKSFADLKGKSLGVTGLGSSTNFLTLYMASKAGLSASDVSTVPVGAGQTFIAAMQQDAIQAGMTTEPTISRMLKTGEAKNPRRSAYAQRYGRGSRRHLSGRLALHGRGLGRCP